MTSSRVVAVDLGASSGRVFLAELDGRRLELHELHRFANGGIEVLGTLYWDVLAMHRGVLEGLAAAGRACGGVDSLGVDTWAVDYGLLDAEGDLAGAPVHYRDDRTLGTVEELTSRVGAEQIYARTGIQIVRFNTLFQLAATASSPERSVADRLLLMPDLLAYFLTGVKGTEVTNASTTQMLRVDRPDWDPDLLALAGVSSAMLPPLREPGSAAGTLLPAVAVATGLSPATPVTTVASHDTASAVVAVPAETDHFAFISCGTWSLVGLELDGPVVDAASREANFSNERGVDSTTRFLRNVMGLWLLQESLRTWQRAGLRVDLADLCERAAQIDELTYVVDPDDPRLLAPGDIPARLAASCRARGEPVPTAPAELTRCILDSLALAYRRTIEVAQTVTGRHVDVVHLVGGGARNAVLCQATADACGVPVVAGPVEAAAIGNALVQLRARGASSADLRELRAVVRSCGHQERYLPCGSRTPAWAAAARRQAGGA